MNLRKILFAMVACAVPLAAHGQAYLPSGPPIVIGGTLPAFAATPTFNQGTPAPVANAWATYQAVSGAAVSPTNPLPIFQRDGTQFTLSGSTAGGPLIGTGTDQTTGAIDTSGFASIGIEISTLQSGALLLVQESSSNTFWNTDGQCVFTSNNGATSANGNLSSATNYTCPLHARYVRVIIQTITSGTQTVVVTMKITNTAPISNFVTPAAGIAAATPFRSSEVGSSVGADGIVAVVTQAGTSAVGKNSAGNLYGAYAINGTTTAGYLACVNLAAAPASGAAITPLDAATIGGTIGATATLNYGAGPPNLYVTGITCLVTTSLTTYTPGGNAFIQVRTR